MKKRKETISRFELNNLIREGKKYRYYFFDYLYYRLYVGYRKHNEPARISSCFFLGMICIILFGFLGLFFNIVAENGAYPPTLNGLIHPVLPLNWP